MLPLAVRQEVACTSLGYHALRWGAWARAFALVWELSLATYYTLHSIQAPLDNLSYNMEWMHASVLVLLICMLLAAGGFCFVFLITVILTACTCEVGRRGTPFLHTGVLHACTYFRRPYYLLQVRRWSNNNNTTRMTEQAGQGPRFMLQTFAVTKAFLWILHLRSWNKLQWNAVMPT